MRRMGKNRRKVQGWLQKGMVLVIGWGVTSIYAEEPTPKAIASTETESNASPPVPERIQNLRKEARWMVPVLSAQYCAQSKALQISIKYNRFLVKRGIIVPAEAEQEAGEYRTRIKGLRTELQRFQRQPESCRNQIVKTLIHCLPSSERIDYGEAVGWYGGARCDKEPFITYAEVETGIEDLSRNQEERLDMHEVAETVQKGLADKKIQAQTSGRVTAWGQTLKVILKPEMENQPEAFAKSIANEYGSLLRKAQYTKVVVEIEGSHLASSWDL